MHFVAPILIALVCVFAQLSQAATLRVAVASNFSHTIKQIAYIFEQQSGHDVSLSFGSTGKHYAQILHGAPFDILFAADTIHPQKLEQTGHTIKDTRFTYAIGRLVLWSPNAHLINGTAYALHTDAFRHLALANPTLAPYGAATEQVLRALGVWDAVKSRLVRGENISQALHFVQSGAAQLGFVAYAHLLALGLAESGSTWHPASNLYQPIVQQAVLLRDTPAARALMRFVKSDAVRALIAQHGYDMPT